VQRGIREWKTPFHVLTSRLRVLPDFIIIGSQRCGTTSLYNYLAEHPCCIPAREKEVHYFDLRYRFGTAWYRTHFPTFAYTGLVARIRGCRLVTGEASPYYVFYPHAARRVRQVLPNVKLIALLRNPVDRAYSHYHHECRLGFEKLSFGEAIVREPDRLRGEQERLREDEGYFSFNHHHYSYVARGVYADQLERWMRLFPTEQLLVAKTEAFYDDPEGVFMRVLSFLGLPSWKLNSYQKYNYAAYGEMDKSIRSRLDDYFKPHNQRLYDLLGMDLGWDR